MSHDNYRKLHPRQHQQRYICDSLDAIWETGSSSTTLLGLLQRAATYHKCAVTDLTDDQIESWCEHEQQRIYQMCADSCLNG